MAELAHWSQYVEPSESDQSEQPAEMDDDAEAQSEDTQPRACCEAMHDER